MGQHRDYLRQRGGITMTLSCPFCRNASRRYFRVTDLNQRRSEESFDYYRCTSCKLIFLSPIPADIDRYYGSSYSAYQKPTLQDLSVRAEEERYKLEIVKRFAPTGRLLEIGPGYGGFAYLAKKAGFEVDAIEMDAGCSAFLSEVVGVGVINASDIIEATAVFDRHYEVITLWHAVEHLADPWPILHKLADKLQPGGILVITSPNPSAFQFSVFGRFWVHVDAPRHVELIPMENLIQHMQALGFTTLLKTTSDKASLVFSTLGWWRVSAANVSEAIAQLIWRKKPPIGDNYDKRTKDDKIPPGSQRTPHVKKMLLSPFYIPGKIKMFILRSLFSLILKPIERIEGLGCAYTLVLKKNECNTNV